MGSSKYINIRMMYEIYEHSTVQIIGENHKNI